ncbi:hypothetical protein SGL43_06639 [Streptomyces globisporus]|uniref:Uncharacterized protein n=1 Tax=Streptomyces globisporus TaxID=1908 RepID=A0ABM9H7H9_STRGL|nr:hypothetical protein [Streptomyces globisporus]CAH9419584.1 hypothetical protein SGL43_06639 [Streptomyces globisporus]
MDLSTLDQATEPAPGLVVFRLAPDHQPHNPQRWRIGHKVSGLAIADSMQHENAIKGAELLSTLTDWTQDADTVKAAIDPTDMFIKLSFVWCIQPGTEPLAAGADASRNGTYTDADIESEAAEFKADGYNAYEILLAMSHRVPWMGLDTEDFNEAHNRIAELAEAN